LEAFVALTVFSKGDFDPKIRAIFIAFDLDGSGCIERKEMLILLLHGVYGLCKLVGLPVPHREDVTQYAYYVFKQIDEDNSDQIEFEKFSAWVRESEELQDFLLKYTG
jgi:Ca2+-binding EF-hand superfamily protein